MSYRFALRPMTVFILTLLAIPVGFSIYFNVRRIKNELPKSPPSAEAMLNRVLTIDELHASAGKSTEVSMDLFVLARLYKDTRDFDKALQLTNRIYESISRCIQHSICK